MSLPKIPNVLLGSRSVGLDQMPYVIAEAGSNHDGRYEQALRLIDVAVEAGADAVKFQLFEAKRLYPKNAGQSDYLGDTRSIYDIIASMEMPRDWLPRLAAYTEARGIALLFSAFDEAAVDFIDPFVVAHKCASYEMTHTPLLQHMARKGKPIILSTGTASLREVETAVNAVREVGNQSLILLQCTASYPAPLETVNARTLATMRDTFGVLTGLSDHSHDPIVAPMTATALGGVLIEKHYTLSRRLPGPDHAFAVEPHELVELVRRVRETFLTLGRGDKEVLAVEHELRSFARRTIFSTRAIEPGEVLDAENIAVLRAGKAGHGLDPVSFTALLGRVAARPIAADHPLEWADLAPPPSAAEGVRGTVTLRDATAADGELVYRWNADPAVRGRSFRPEGFTLESHLAWWRERLAEPTTLLRIVQLDGLDAGCVRVERSGEEAVISVVLGPDAKGRGASAAAISQATTTYRAAHAQRAITAYIKPDNEASVRAFERAGYARVGVRDIAGQTALVYIHG